MLSRLFEKDIDTLLLRNLRTSDLFLSNFLQLAGILPLPSVKPNIIPQTRHRLDSGSIDIEMQFGRSLVVLVENKINARYSINQVGSGQVERYVRSRKCIQDQGCKASIVLVAPKIYLETTKSIDRFDAAISYESLCRLLNPDDQALLYAAIQQASLPYEPVPNIASGDFFDGLKELVTTNYPNLVLKASPNPNGVRPTGSHTVYFDVRKTLNRYQQIKETVMMSLQCWDKAAPSASVKIMIGKWGRHASILPIPPSLRDIGGYLRPASQSLGIVVDTPRLDTQKTVIEQLESVSEGLESATRLQDWWNNNEAALDLWTQYISQQR